VYAHFEMPCIPDLKDAEVSVRAIRAEMSGADLEIKNYAERAGLQLSDKPWTIVWLSPQILPEDHPNESPTVEAPAVVQEIARHMLNVSLLD
jgi:hypothetical protein